MIIQGSCLDLVRDEYKKMEFIVNSSEKRNYIEKIISELKDEVDIDKFQHFTHKFNFEQTKLSFDISSIINTMYNFKSTGQDVFQLDEIEYTQFSSKYYDFIEIEEEEEFNKTFLRLNNDLIVGIIDYINLTYWIDEYNKNTKESVIIQTKELERCVDIIGYYIHYNEKVISKLLNENTNVTNVYINPFVKELNQNLLNKNGIQNKEDLIKHYIFEFVQLNSSYKNHTDILHTGTLHIQSPTHYKHEKTNGIKRTLDEFEIYTINSHNLFLVIFNEIQLSCIKYSIDFFEICHKLNFNLEQIDSGITITSENNKPTETINQNEHNHIFSNNGFKLFEYLMKNFVTQKRGHQRDVLFCYHKLFNNDPKLIHQRTQPFLDWYNASYENEINQTLTYPQIRTDKREKLYSRVLALFKQ